MSLHALANNMAARGRGPDSTLVHMSPREVHGLQALAMANGGSLTINPQTGLPEAGFLENLLPALAGFALNAFMPGVGGAIGSALGFGEAAASTVGTGLLVGGATGLATGSLEKGLMAGLGAYGGAGLAGSLGAAGGVQSGMDAASAARDAGMSAAAEASPAATAARLQAGVNTAMSAPVDALKNNAWNLGFAAAPGLTGTFDNQQPSSGLKIHPGYIRGYDKDPVTGTLYQTSATPADQYTGGIKFGGVPEIEGYPKIKGYARGGYAEFNEDFIPSSRRVIDVGDDGFGYTQPAYTPPAPVYSAPEPLKGIEALTPAYSAPAYTPPAYSTPEDGGQQSARERRLAELDADRNIDSNRPTPARGIEALVPPEGGEIDRPITTMPVDMGGGRGDDFGGKIDNPIVTMPVDVYPKAPPQAPITTPETPVEDVPDDSEAVDETAKTINFGGVGQLEPVNTSPADSLLSDSQRVQNYLMGKGPNPFTVYHKTKETPVEKAQVATKTLPKKVIKPEQRGGSGGNGTSTTPGAGAAQFGGSGFTGSTTNSFGDSGPTTGAASLANSAAAALGNAGLVGLSNAIAANVNPNYGHEAALANSKALAATLSGPQAANPMGTDPSQRGESNGDGGGSGVTGPDGGPTGSRASDGGWGGEGRGGSGRGGDGGGPATGGHDGDASGGGDRGTRGGFALGGYLDQRYADGGTTGSGSLDLHVPINIGGEGGGAGGGGMGGGFGGGQYQPVGQGGGMGGGLGGLLNQGSNGRGDFGPQMQGGMSQPSPNFLQQQMNSLPGFQSMQKAQQDFTNSDDYKNFQNYAQEYQQQFQPQQQPSAFGGAMGGSRYGLGQGAQNGLYGGTPIGKPSYEQYLAGRSPYQQDVPLAREQYENPQQGPSNPASRMAAGGITALADGGMYNLGSYSDGGRLLRGPGDGVSDDIPATIGENQPARLADGEFVVPARIVSEIGNGSTEAGARKLYAMMDRVQKSRAKTVGKNKVAANTRADKYLPA
ncbi:hypothetical protein UFOVP1049_65 [uncultured Caudovirales phage]|uniref:Uncharacterized protein n=1 Tax=uncultured Caudovirales phage TaxID=2100421 RepID=A0A6J5QM31_9CAUD|nr:hypothetical protein UFOVP1049_65 [uncultured Caudovirales phage]